MSENQQFPNDGVPFKEDALSEQDVANDQKIAPYFMREGDPNDSNDIPTHFHTATATQIVGWLPGENFEEALHRTAQNRKKS